MRIDAVLAEYYRRWRAVRGRVFNHAVLLAVFLAAATLSRVPVPETLQLPGGRQVPGSATAQDRRLASLARGGGQVEPSGDVLARAANLHTTIPERQRRGVITYTVQEGDTPISIAWDFNLDPRTILWGNSDLGNNPELLQIGDVLNILPVDGVLHVVAEGDTVDSVAAAYGVSPAVITDSAGNPIQKGAGLATGAELIVPGGQREFVVWSVPEPPAAAASGSSGQQGGSYYSGPAVVQGIGSYIWPITGRITQSYWWGHRALDISAVIGTPIAASDSGTVIFAGWSTAGYGNLIVIDHGNGAQTYYAHQSAFAVELGQAVSQGQLIGYVGSTGRSTGPHLHFEIRYGGDMLNPWDYLP